MVDRTVKFIDLFMLYQNLADVKEMPLPQGTEFSKVQYNSADNTIKYRYG